MLDDAKNAAVRYRAIWISDVHMGTRASQVGTLLEFLRQNESETLYLVGDIFDGWALKRSAHTSLSTRPDNRARTAPHTRPSSGPDSSSPSSRRRRAGPLHFQAPDAAAPQA